MRNVASVAQVVGMAAAPLRTPRVRLTRDLAMFIVGAALLIYEALARAASDPQIVYASLAMMGIASYLRGMAAGKDDSRD